MQKNEDGDTPPADGPDFAAQIAALTEAQTATSKAVDKLAEVLAAAQAKPPEPPPAPATAAPAPPAVEDDPEVDKTDEQIATEALEEVLAETGVAS